MKQENRLRFYLTLFSAFASKRQAVFATVVRWLKRASALQRNTSDWTDITEELLTSLGNALRPDLRILIDEQVEKMAIQNIDVVTLPEASYPQALLHHLNNKAPLFLWFRGNSRLFDNLSVGFFCSRHASELLLEVCS